MATFTRRASVLRSLSAFVLLGVNSLLIPLAKAGVLLPRTERSFVVLKYYLQRPNGQVVERVGRFPQEVVTIAQNNLIEPGARLIGLWRGVNGYVPKVLVPNHPAGPNTIVIGPAFTRQGRLLLKAAEQRAGIYFPSPT